MENEELGSKDGMSYAARFAYAGGQTIPKLIIVGGEKEDCFLLEMIIKSIDVSKAIMPVHNSTELLGFLDLQLPELIFMDLEMPCGKGALCLKQIRDDARTKELHIVCFSRSSRPSNRTLALALGANDFLDMFGDLPYLTDQVKKILSTKATTR